MIEGPAADFWPPGEHTHHTPPQRNGYHVLLCTTGKCPLIKFQGVLFVLVIWKTENSPAVAYNWNGWDGKRAGYYFSIVSLKDQQTASELWSLTLGCTASKDPMQPILVGDLWFPLCAAYGWFLYWNLSLLSVWLTEKNLPSNHFTAGYIGRKQLMDAFVLGAASVTPVGIVQNLQVCNPRQLWERVHWISRLHHCSISTAFLTWHRHGSFL